MLIASDLFKSEASVQNRSTEIVALITLTHPSIETQRFVSDVSDITVNGETYTAFPFGFTFPGDGDTIPEANIVIQNVDKRIGQAVRQAKGEIGCTLAAVLREEPDQIIADYPGMILKNVSVGNGFISGTLAGRINSNSAWPGLTASPSLTPGLYFT